MKNLFFVLVLLCLAPVWPAEPTKAFQPPDHTFQITVPGRVLVSEKGEGGRFFWGSDDGRQSYLFGYTTIERAAKMEEDDLVQALGQLLSGFETNSNFKERNRARMKYAGHVGLEASGVGGYGNSWVRVLAVGPRIYVLASDGTPEAENKSYWESFKLLEGGKHR